MDPLPRSCAVVIVDCSVTAVNVKTPKKENKTVPVVLSVPTVMRC